MPIFPSVRVAGAVVALAALAATQASAQAPLESLRPELEARIARHRGTVAVSVVDPRTGESLSIRGDEPFPSASIIKLPVLVELFHQIEQRRLRWEDPLVLLEADKVPGSGILQHLTTPHHLTIGDAALLMITLSDNTATNLILDKVGIRSVWERMEALGLPRTKVHSKTFMRSTSVAPDSSARYGLGVITANEIARLLAMIYRGEVVSPEASRRMIEILEKQFYAEGIPRHLGDARVAHKTGSLDAARHDCGIVFSEARDYVLCILTRDNADRSWGLDNEAHLLIADLARLVHARLAPAAQE
jgi:beta-lactamase class A